MFTQYELKQNVARAAVQYVLPFLKPDTILGVGTGSTVDMFIDALAVYKDRFQGAVSSSERSSARMSALGISVFDLNQVESMPLYVDGADRSEEHTSELQSLMRISYAVFCLKKKKYARPTYTKETT